MPNASCSDVYLLGVAPAGHFPAKTFMHPSGTQRLAGCQLASFVANVAPQHYLPNMQGFIAGGHGRNKSPLPSTTAGASLQRCHLQATKGSVTLPLTQPDPVPWSGWSGTCHGRVVATCQHQSLCTCIMHAAISPQGRIPRPHWLLCTPASLPKQRNASQTLHLRLTSKSDSSRRSAESGSVRWRCTDS